MLGNRKLVLDTFCEVYDQLKPWADAEFWNFAEHDLIPNAVYLIGREQFKNNRDRIVDLANTDTIRVVLSNPAEGSETLLMHCSSVYGIEQLVKQKQMLLIGGGDMDADWPCLQYDTFLPKIFDYQENIQAAAADTFRIPKPKTFLFLNGRYRPHRQYLLQEFDSKGLLDNAIWSNLDSRNGPVHYLDAQYEFEWFRNRTHTVNGFVKYELFDNLWGEVYIEPRPYCDSYFSVVTETVVDYPHSFRTEKIWKPIAMAHPWIAVANRGYYRDMRNLGFKTFGHVIDESFDQTDDTQTRLERIATIVRDLCQQDLAKFLAECYTTCKYNQQHLVEMRERVRKEFPNRFFQFITQHQFNE